MNRVRLHPAHLRRRRPWRRAREPGAAYLAAGTNLLDLMKGGVTRPDPHRGCRTRLPGLWTSIEHAARRRHTHRRAGAQRRPRARCGLRAPHYPAVAEALLSGASAQLRNAATLGRQHPPAHPLCRISTTRPAPATNASPAAGCDAIGACDTRLHAVLGWSEQLHRHAPVRPIAVPLVALDAVVEIDGTAGRREVPLDGVPPASRASTPERETVLAAGES